MGTRHGCSPGCISLLFSGHIVVTQLYNQYLLSVQPAGAVRSAGTRSARSSQSPPQHWLTVVAASAVLLHHLLGTAGSRQQVSGLLLPQTLRRRLFISNAAGVAIEMKQADPSSAVAAVASSKVPSGLLGLPTSCLHRIVSYMDKHTKLQFFRTSKGTTQQPGCAVLVLRASKLKVSYVYLIYIDDQFPRLSFRRLLHWAAQISTEIELLPLRYIFTSQSAPYRLTDVLHSLLLYPEANTTAPAEYPGITSLELRDYEHPSLIAEDLIVAFPNLKSLTYPWSPATPHQLGPVQTRGLSRLEHFSGRGHIQAWSQPTVSQHILQQLSHMPSLTSIDVSSHMFEALPPAALAKLRSLQLYSTGAPTAKAKAALKVCTQLETLLLRGGNQSSWIALLPQHVPSIRTLNTVEPMSDRVMPHLLALPHLTSLTMWHLRDLYDNYSKTPCSWKQLRFDGECTSSSVTNLPLRAVDSRIHCDQFQIDLSDPASELAAIKAAKPQLLRCGGIELMSAELSIGMEEYDDEIETQGRLVARLLKEWAACLSEPEVVVIDECLLEVAEETAIRLWPGAEVTST